MGDNIQQQSVKIAGLLKNLHELHVQLESHARIGLTLFQREELEAFDDSWKKREALFSKITALAHKLQPAFSDWERIVAAMTPAAADQCNEYLDDIRRLANSTHEYDEKLRPLLQNAKQDQRGTIQKIDNGKKLIRAYGGGQFRRKPPAGISRNG